MSKLLIIEDDTLVSRMYQKAFSFAKIDTHLANDGRSGLDLARQISPDLILCDIMMPEMNGLEVLDKIKADPKLNHIPVIMLTNLSGTTDCETALAKGAAQYLIKSEHKPKELVEKVSQFLNNPKSTPSQVSPTPKPTPTPQSPPPFQQTPSSQQQPPNQPPQPTNPTPQPSQQRSPIQPPAPETSQKH